jgi:hypothetical protein
MSSKRGHGQIRRSQAVTTWGPGALIDLPKDSAIVGGLETWPRTSSLDEIPEPRLARKLELMTGVAAPKLYAPPPESNHPSKGPIGIRVWRFPEWFVVQEGTGAGGERRGSRRLVHRKALDERGRFEKFQVVATRFVRACPKGHVDDLEWRYFVHGAEDLCRRQIWLDEHGTSGDLGDLSVRCECGKTRGLLEATFQEGNPLGHCTARAPGWAETPTSCVRGRAGCSFAPPRTPTFPGGERALASGPGLGGGDGGHRAAG